MGNTLPPVRADCRPHPLPRPKERKSSPPVRCAPSNPASPRHGQKNRRPPLARNVRKPLPPEPSPISRTTTYAYTTVNGRSVLTSIDGPRLNGPTAGPEDSDATTFAWDQRGDFVASVAAPGGFATVLTRDEAGRVTVRTLNDGARRIETCLDYAEQGSLALTPVRVERTDWPLAKGTPVETGRVSLRAGEVQFNALGETTRMTPAGRLPYETGGHGNDLTSPDKTYNHTALLFFNWNVNEARTLRMEQDVFDQIRFDWNVSGKDGNGNTITFASLQPFLEAWNKIKDDGTKITKIKDKLAELGLGPIEDYPEGGGPGLACRLKYFQEAGLIGDNGRTTLKGVTDYPDAIVDTVKTGATTCKY